MNPLRLNSRRKVSGREDGVGVVQPDPASLEKGTPICDGTPPFGPLGEPLFLGCSWEIGDPPAVPFTGSFVPLLFSWKSRSRERGAWNGAFALPLVPLSPVNSCILWAHSSAPEVCSAAFSASHFSVPASHSFLLYCSPDNLSLWISIP